MNYNFNNIKIGFVFLSLVFGSVFLTSQTPQITIPRISQMPFIPNNFEYKNWRVLAQKYDSLVYDVQRTGQYLPLSYMIPQGVNYPERKFFGLHTYVGTNSPLGNEAINVLPSLVGASLVGIDKSNQFGNNWILMSQDFFNKKNGENIYLNNNFTSSGNDWWYDLMPNLFFYQLFHLYPSVGGNADQQFITIADRFLEAVKTMGGDATPWQKANMNYRAFKFKTQEPNASGVKEPEAAGAYAWVLYNAYSRTGNPEYLKGAEWSMEFLNGLNVNPSYELMLPYGTYMAARMNAELGTKYNVEKMVNWSFNKGPLRNWGTILGQWNGYDVSGLVGEANDAGNDYAFQLNGIQQAAALVPMLRYDKRFAHAVGQWLTNLINATRWFYPNELPNDKMDAADWSSVHDPDGVIGYEALREVWQGVRPLATGDAKRGNWAATNLSLYSTSSIGYLAGMVQPTNVSTIQMYDLLKTDFFHGPAYPTYLLFNPSSEVKSVNIDLGSELKDVYNTVTESFLHQDKSGIVQVSIQPRNSVILVMTPANGTIVFKENKMFVDGVVVDYLQSSQSFNYAPRIQSLASDTLEVEQGKSSMIYAQAFDQDSDELTYNWSVTGGTIIGNASTVSWQAPNNTGDYTITLIVEDELGQSDTATLNVKSVGEINLPPQVNLIASALYVEPNGTLSFTGEAMDPNGDAMNWSWSASGGDINGTGINVDWNAPSTTGNYEIILEVADDKGLSTSVNVVVLVYSFPASYGATLIAWYPFNENGKDSTANHLDGVISGARFVPDFNNKPASALLFDGINDKVTINTQPILNVQDGIALSSWFYPSSLPNRESFILSHGSWQNRYKVSITPDRYLRWTIKTNVGTSDLDSRIKINTGQKYFLTVTYDGQLMAIYLDGQLVGSKPMTGKLAPSDLDFLIGQMIPDDANYNFTGIIDEVKIFNQARTPIEIIKDYNYATLNKDGISVKIDASIAPNPATNYIHINTNDRIISGSFRLVNIFGQEMASNQRWETGLTKIDVSHFVPGWYYFIGRSKNGFCIMPFIKVL